MAVASILALEKSRAVDVALAPVQSAEAEHGEVLTAREHLIIS